MFSKGKNPSELIRQITHRPWDLPDTNWRYYQEWNNALFLHWKIAPDIITSLLPSNLKVDIIDETTWISVVAFTMQKIRPRNLPAASFISDFHEINLVGSPGTELEFAL